MGNQNTRWNLSGIVVMVLPFKKYRVKLNGSGRIVTRNHHLLRVYKHKTPSHTVEYQDIPENLSHNGNGSLPAVGDEEVIDSTIIVEPAQNHDPFNKPGFMEDTRDI